MELVKVTNGEIRLNSMLDEYLFGKTKYDSVITQQGILFTCDSLDNNRYHFSHETFTFETIRSDDVPGYTKPLVFYCREASGFDENSKTLLQFFEDAEKTDASAEQKKQMQEAAFIVISILTQAALEKIQIPEIGGGGILIQLDNEKTKVLFLPSVLFKTSSAGLPKVEDSIQNGCWINSTLFELPFICFERAVIAYRMLTGRFPFTATELDERNADILDRKFRPMELSINGINLELAEEINRSLKLTSNAVNIPGKKQKGKNSEDLTPVPEFPLELLYAEKDGNNSSRLPDEVFEHKVQAFERKQRSKVSAKRTVRRNISKIVIGAVTAVVVIIIAVHTRNTRMQEYIPVGLTSTEVIEGFMRGVNDKDTSLMQNFSSGKSAGNFQKTVSQIYVLHRQRIAYDGDHGFPSPQEWVLYLQDEGQWQHTSVYGITGLKIDGKDANLHVQLQTSKDKPEILRTENGKELENKEEIKHKVEYFVVHTEGEDNMVYVDFCTDTFTLTYKKDRWIITDILSHVEKIKVKTADFINDYYSTYRRTILDPVRTVELLSSKYPWLPEAQLVKEVKEQLTAEAMSVFSAF